MLTNSSETHFAAKLCFNERIHTDAWMFFRPLGDVQRTKHMYHYSLIFKGILSDF